jgi:hypothetical protein
MARTPSMSTAECESILGARGALCVTSDNRGTVQKWMVAKGVPASVAKSAKLSTLAKAYNDTSDRYVNAIIRNTQDAVKDAVQDNERHDDTHSIPEPKVQDEDFRDRMQPRTHDTKDAAAEHLFTALRLLTEHGAVTEPRVIELIREHAPKPDSVTVRQEIVIKRDDTERTLPDAPRHMIFADALATVAADVNLFLVGPAGSGKTTLAAQIAEALELPFQFNGALDSPYKLSGFIDAQGRIVSTAFRRAYSEGAVYLFDEVDASLPGALLAFNAALANGHADFPDGTIERHPNFRCIAAANTFGLGADRQYVGRNQLDAASLDRFAFLEMPYDEKLERLLAGDTDWTAFVQSARHACDTLKLRHVVSPRASIAGAKMLSRGMKRETVERMTVWKGLDAATVRKVQEAM